MIIKVKDVRKKSWWVFGEIQKIRYETGIPLRDAPADPDISILIDRPDADPEIHYTPESKPIVGSEYPVAILIFRDINDNEKCLMFDTVAYICNEQGQTIEKIVP